MIFKKIPIYFISQPVEPIVTTLRKDFPMENGDLTEIELLKGCIAGDKKRWAAFVERYNKLIYHTIYKTLRVNATPTDPDDINDLFQEIFASFCANDCKKLRMFDPQRGVTLSSRAVTGLLFRKWSMVVRTVIILSQLARLTPLWGSNILNFLQLLAQKEVKISWKRSFISSGSVAVAFTRRVL